MIRTAATWTVCLLAGAFVLLALAIWRALYHASGGPYRRRRAR